MTRIAISMPTCLGARPVVTVTGLAGVSLDVIGECRLMKISQQQRNLGIIAVNMKAICETSAKL